MPQRRTFLRPVDREFDDIPLAQRAVVPLTRQGSLQRRLGLRVLIAAALLAAAALALPVLMAIAPRGPAPDGLPARPDRDGRLLGHFPYRDTTSAELLEVAPGLKLQRDAARALVAMREAAAADGVNLVVLSAYRSVDLQKQLFFDVKAQRNQSAVERARVSAPPGYSEHSTGYAVDLGDSLSPQTHLNESFEQSEAFAWLQRHAARFHFTLSFPRGNAQGVNYEPWHWRFEGTADALRLFEPAQRLAR